jgi:hypothetical protein
MNPTLALKRLLGSAVAGLLAITLVAQIPSASHETHGGAAGTALHPNEGPLGAIDAHLCGFHFYSGDMKRAIRVDHYCSHVNADIFQCVIYDSAAKNARLIGVEYIISEALFKQLPAEEKKLWHSHRYEVMSGQLTASGLSDAAEKELMQEFVSTYGKTWNLWQVDRGDALPLGLPKLMMGFTADGQARSRSARRFGPGESEARGLSYPTGRGGRRWLAARAGLSNQRRSPEANSSRSEAKTRRKIKILGVSPGALKTNCRSGFMPRFRQTIAA